MFSRFWYSRQRDLSSRFSRDDGWPVKPLHPRARWYFGSTGVDDKIMSENGIGPIDMVVVNLYPFAETIAREDCTEDLAIENIDIGGPAMIRSSLRISVMSLLWLILQIMKRLLVKVSGDCSLEFRRELAESFPAYC